MQQRKQLERKLKKVRWPKGYDTLVIRQSVVVKKSKPAEALACHRDRRSPMAAAVSERAVCQNIGPPYSIVGCCGDDHGRCSTALREAQAEDLSRHHPRHAR
jgi:hypothetical protein